FSYFVWGRKTVVREPEAVAAGSAAFTRGSASTASVEFGEGDDDDARFSADDVSGDRSQMSATDPFTFEQLATVVAIIVLLGSVVLVAALGGDPDIGILCFGLSALLLLLKPSR